MKSKTTYLDKYSYDWDFINILVGGKSSLDSNKFIPHLNTFDEITAFIKSYGIDIDNGVSHAELFGNFQEALQFIRKYFLIEGTTNGLKLTIPNSILMLSDIRSLFLMASVNSNYSKDEQLWSEVVLKVMHTILHVDKDLRSRYFSTIQTQILDRYYKHIFRDDDGVLFLKDSHDLKIELVRFETKSKKTRDSVIIKLLHKAENVAEELFDRIGIRIITKGKFDTLRVLKFLVSNNIVIPHNIKPSRSLNTLFNIDEFKSSYSQYLETCKADSVLEDDFLVGANKLISMCSFSDQGSDSDKRNQISLNKYRSMQFTCRQLIYYKNPIFNDVKDIRNIARMVSEKENYDNEELISKILKLDLSKMLTELKFFYPYEVQIVDELSNIENTSGEASHQKYKEKQVVAARDRIFRQFYIEGLLK